MRPWLVHALVTLAVLLAPHWHLQAQSSGVTGPRKLKDAKPVYPERVLSRGDEGYVIVELKVDASGRVAEARVLRSTCPVFDEAALTATRKWQFEQVLVNGEPTSFTMTTHVPFRLPEKLKSRAGRPGSCRWVEPAKPIY